MSAAAILGALVCLTAPAVQSDKRLAELVRDLGKERDHRTRYAAYRELQRKLPPRALALLVKALPGFGPSSQGLGVTLVGRYPRGRAVPALRKLAAADDAFLSLSACVWLYQLGERSFAGKVARILRRPGLKQQELTRMLTRAYAVRDPAVRAAVLDLLRPGIAAGPLDAVLYKLLQGRDRAAAVPRVTELLAAPQTGEPSAALCAAFLVAAGVEAATADLARLLEAGHAKLTRIQRYLQRVESVNDELVRAIVARIDAAGVNRHERTTGIRLLGRFGGARAVTALRRLRRDPEDKIATAALDALSKVTGALDPKDMVRLLGSEDAETALKAAENLRRMDDLSGLPRVLELARAPGTHRMEAVRVLGGFRVRKAVPPLLDALAANDANVRRIAFSGLQSTLRALFPYKRLDLASTGYGPDAPAPARAAGLNRLRSWWARAVKN